MEETKVLMHRTQSENDVINKVQEICERFALAPVLSNVLGKNKSNNLPYHNWYHTNCVVLNCYEGANYHNLSYDSIRDLLIAAMFHDFNHSGGELTDDKNIAAAKEGLMDLYGGIVNTTKIGKFIECTEYPFNVKPCCIEQKILRDADVMQWFMPNSISMIIVGLKSEVEKTKGKIDDNDWLDIQYKFMSSVELYSEWGEAKFRNKLPRLLNQIEGMKNVN